MGVSSITKRIGNGILPFLTAHERQMAITIVFSGLVGVGIPSQFDNR
jgi:hypothetical protein